jgi:hypothetical protein
MGKYVDSEYFADYLVIKITIRSLVIVSDYIVVRITIDPLVIIVFRFIGRANVKRIKSGEKCNSKKVRKLQ